MQFVSTRGGGEPLGFCEAFAQGLAPDGGLFVPKDLPRLPDTLILDEEPEPYPMLAWEFLSLFDSDHDSDELMSIIDDSYGDFNPTIGCAPLQQLARNVFVLELFHGPTLAFKDFGLQLVGNLFADQIRRTGRTINVLGATSGDTGSAAIHGLAGKDGVNVFILYPEGRISKLQERQMTCTGAKNIFPIPIQGTFDDAQRIVKELMGDLKFKQKLRLSAINSINIVRILAQSVYYVHALMQLAPEDRKNVNFIVPTGNFGNIFAGWMTGQMGLPVDRFTVATNQNDILYHLFNTGEYQLKGVSPSHAPSMDIEVASNFERFLYYHEGKDASRVVKMMAEFKKKGRLRIPRFHRDNFRATRCDDQEILANIRRAREDYGYVADPHTACALSGIDPEKTNVLLATAHPAKFPDVIHKAIGEKPVHPALEALKRKKPVKYPVEPTALAVRLFLEINALA